MKKIFSILIIFIFCFFVYNSKTENYNKSKEFYLNNFNAEIKKIEEGRGIKIYYENEKYFYESDYEGVKLKVGDMIIKSESKIIVRRKNSNGEYSEIGIGKSKKPKENYFTYFFNT